MGGGGCVDLTDVFFLSCAQYGQRWRDAPSAFSAVLFLRAGLLPHHAQFRRSSVTLAAEGERDRKKSRVGVGEGQTLYYL